MKRRFSRAVILLSLLGALDVHAATQIRVLKTRIQEPQPMESRMAEAVRSRIDISKYREVRAQLIRDAQGKPSHYLVYLLSLKYHRVDFVKISVDQQLNVLGVQQNYKLQAMDFTQQPGVAPSHAACPDSFVQFIAFAPNDIQLEQDVTLDVASAATAAKLKTVKLLKSQATRDSYLNYMTCPKLLGNFYDGDANPQLIITVDSVISADDIKTILKGKFQYRTTNIWLACEAYNNPMLSAVVDDAQTKKFAAGINDLLVGPSDNAGACAMKAAIAGKPMQASFNTCYKQFDVPDDHWGFGGNGSDSFWSGGYVCSTSFPAPAIKYDHKDSAGRVYIPVQNWAAYASTLFTAAPDLPPCGLNKSASRTWIDIYNADTNARIYGFCAFGVNTNLKDIWFLPSAPHGHAYIVMNDRGCGRSVKSNTITW
jgi:hypothetical protein